jgi:hypothetical protein
MKVILFIGFKKIYNLYVALVHFKLGMVRKYGTLSFAKECNYEIRADQMSSTLIKFIINSISIYVSK